MAAAFNAGEKLAQQKHLAANRPAASLEAVEVLTGGDGLAAIILTVPPHLIQPRLVVRRGQNANPLAS